MTSSLFNLLTDLVTVLQRDRTWSYLGRYATPALRKSVKCMSGLFANYITVYISEII